MEFETIDIRDEKARELAQILANDTALSILSLLQEKTLSMSEIAKELDIPISTVSYHLDKMIRVGFVEIAGKKYGKRLQEVKLYRASSKPIVLLPRRVPVKKRLLRVFEKVQIISLGIAGLLASATYVVLKKLVSERSILELENATRAAKESQTPLVIESVNKTVMQGPGEGSLIPYVSAILIFIVAFLILSHYLTNKNI
ncbi:MAG TPA: transcriptional regulator [Thermococcus sp.]|uniref:ArsR/SmtB family transcription factor n=1 Tax=Thermococcus sp. TaxID=35749 RepID=UPI000BC4BC95|nr:helix-turn-helix domain-containing protein [Thermococcus sp.]OYT33137.1 MAG: transcriptional regulator [Archaeoglobales archaeon ex4484_92]RLF80258.1 MAG: transcriptional regulator [Thermococci archaeon]MCD6140417.1 helix-turn-helix domain-containing protein [Thermococcus sp.]MCD6142921.1 helix-turn-helix domain-containing protein [Thermococcus sp.]HDH45067.1 transcriptional regulator [Thermococcus sp.]